VDTKTHLHRSVALRVLPETVLPFLVN